MNSSNPNNRCQNFSQLFFRRQAFCLQQKLLLFFPIALSTVKCCPVATIPASLVHLHCLPICLNKTFIQYTAILCQAITLNVSQDSSLSNTTSKISSGQRFPVGHFLCSDFHTCFTILAATNCFPHDIIPNALLTSRWNLFLSFCHVDKLITCLSRKINTLMFYFGDFHLCPHFSLLQSLP